MTWILYGVAQKLLSKFAVGKKGATFLHNKIFIV